MSDWRLEHLGTQPYLRGVAFTRKAYSEYRPGWDHDHCAGCWLKLAEFDDPSEPVEHEGYASTAEYERGADYVWICLKCFADFKDQMGWKEV